MHSDTVKTGLMVSVLSAIALSTGCGPSMRTRVANAMQG